MEVLMGILPHHLINAFEKWTMRRSMVHDLLVEVMMIDRVIQMALTALNGGKPFGKALLAA